METQSNYMRSYVGRVINNHFILFVRERGPGPKTPCGASFKTSPKVVEMPIKNSKFFDEVEFNEMELYIAKEILKEIKERLKFLADVGLDYITLDRSSGTLSGGEAQRIRLATQIGSGLVRGSLRYWTNPVLGCIKGIMQDL